MIRNSVTLYSIDKTRKVRFYTITSIISDYSCFIEEITGIVEGSKASTRRKDIKRGKAGRSLYEQLMLEYNSKIAAKKNEGYKSYNDLHSYINSLGYCLKDVPTLENILRAYEILNWQNYGTNWTPLPMLAKTWDKKGDIFIIQPKLDGVRCMSYVEKGKVMMVSRGSQYFNLPHIAKELEQIFLKSDVMLDGELYVHGVPLNKISGTVRADNPIGAAWIEYHIFDVPIIYGENKRQEDRMGYLMTTLKELVKDLKYIKIVEASVANKIDLQAAHDQFVIQGYEGIIL